MSAKALNVKEYLVELQKDKDERPEQVRQGLEIFLDLWKKAIEKGVVSESDKVDEALAKIDAMGGLYKAAED